jgi:hypothetical protein
MFWVLQKNLFNESAFGALLEQLDRQQVQYQIVDIIPFAHEMVPDIDPQGLVMCLGATSMNKVAVKKGWTPGYFGDNLSYDLLIQNYGEHMMNYNAVIAPLRDLTKKWDYFFIRPMADTKQFSGTMMTWYDFEDWRRKINYLDGQASYTTLTCDDIVVMAEPHNIKAEYRFFVVDGKVITGSMYKLGNQIIHSDRVDESVYAYAQQMVNIWQPNRAFDLDIFETDEGYKIGEINAINSAGFYACDMGKFINAIESMKF